MAKHSLIAVVEDDQPFRESMRKLMTSLGYTVEAFPSAADFLASPLLATTACLVSDPRAAFAIEYFVTRVGLYAAVTELLGC